MQRLNQAGVAQLVEQLIRNQQVAGSSPIAGSDQIMDFSGLIGKSFIFLNGFFDI